MVENVSGLLIPFHSLAAIVVSQGLLAGMLWFIVRRALSGSECGCGENSAVQGMVASLLCAWVLGLVYLKKFGFFTTTQTLTGSLVIPVLIGSLFAYCSTTRSIIDAMPQHLLIGAHIIRLVGFIALVLFDMGQLPASIALPMGYGHIAFGLTAPLLAYWFLHEREYHLGLTFMWHLAGLAHLVWIASLGIPFLAAAGIPSQLILPGFGGAMLILLHVYGLCALLRPEGGRIFIFRIRTVQK